jgi:hypothetical protein
LRPPCSRRGTPSLRVDAARAAPGRPPAPPVVGRRADARPAGV